MKKIIRLTETDLTKLIKRVINEQSGLGQGGGGSTGNEKTIEFERFCSRLFVDISKQRVKYERPSEPALLIFKQATTGMGWMSQSTLDRVISTIKSLSPIQLCTTIKAYGEQHPKKLTFYEEIFSYLDARWAEDKVFNTMLDVIKSNRDLYNLVMTDKGK
jgi:hypothetical protein